VPGASKPPAVSHLRPVGCLVGRPAKAPPVHEGLQQQHRMAEALPPIGHQPPLAQPQNARPQIRKMPARQDQKAAVVDHQLEPVELMPEVPADPLVPRRTLPGRRRETYWAQPLLPPNGYVAERLADLRKSPQVVVLLHQGLITSLFPRKNRLNHDFPQIQRVHAGEIARFPAKGPDFSAII